MGEGTKVFDAQAEIAELRRRIETLESQRVMPPAGPVHYPVPSLNGCVCPVGAELGCGNAGCPRRRPPGYYPWTATCGAR